MESGRPIGIEIKNIYNHMKNDVLIINSELRKPQEINLYQPRICPNLNKKFIITAAVVFIIIILIIILYSLFFKNTHSGPEDKPIFKDFLDKDDDETYTEYKDSPKLSSGNYRICAYGAEANPGGKGGKVCVYNEELKQNEVIKYKLGGRKAGGKRGEKCGKKETEGNNGAGMAIVKYKNKKNKEILLIAGGGGGNSDSNNKGGNAEEDGYGYFKGIGARKNKAGEKGDEDAGDGSCDFKKGGKGGKGGGDSDKARKAGKWCGGGGGDGYCGGGGGGWGDPKNAGGGGGGSNYCTYDSQNSCSYEINKEYKYSGITIHKNN